MTKRLLTEAEIEATCPILAEDLELYMGENDSFAKSDEATIYALGQLIQDRLENIDLELSEKGVVVAQLIHTLAEHNAEALAVHNDIIKHMLEQKASTIQ